MHIITPQQQQSATSSVIMVGKSSPSSSSASRIIPGEKRKKRKSNEVFVEGEVVQDPQPMDVLGTRQQALSKTHPGNMFYRELINKYSVKGSTSEEQKKMAQKVVAAICNDKKGRFLKEMGTGWVVLNYNRSVQKVVLAFKNAQYKFLGYPDTSTRTNTSVTIGQESSSAGQGGAAVGDKIIKRPHVPSRKHKELGIATASSAKRRKSPSAAPARQLVAVQGAKTIHPYLLSIISKVATISDPEASLKVLDKPAKKGAESHQERLMRLQLRHRYYAAWDGQMKPRDFSKKILDFWGGKLVETTIAPSQQRQRPKTPPNSGTENNTHQRKQQPQPQQQQQQQNKEMPVAKEPLFEPMTPAHMPTPTHAPLPPQSQQQHPQKMEIPVSKEPVFAPMIPAPIPTPTHAPLPPQSQQQHPQKMEMPVVKEPVFAPMIPAPVPTPTHAPFPPQPQQQYPQKMEMPVVKEPVFAQMIPGPIPTPNTVSLPPQPFMTLSTQPSLSTTTTATATTENPLMTTASQSQISNFQPMNAPVTTNNNNNGGPSFCVMRHGETAPSSSSSSFQQKSTHRMG